MNYPRIKTCLISVGLLFSIYSSSAISNNKTKNTLPDKFQGLVVSGIDLADRVGLNILKQGGNAVDAAVAVGYALAVVDPCCGNIGGGGFMVIHSKNGQNNIINFREKAPKAIKTSLFLDKQGRANKAVLKPDDLRGDITKGYLSVGVPGTVMGLNVALEKYGTMSLKKVVTPAIKLAKNGFTVNKVNHRYFQTALKYLRLQKNLTNTFLKNNQPLADGDLLIQTNLANVLTQIAQHGSDVFYRGEIADKLVHDIQKNGGVISKDDLRDYTVEFQQPIVCEYKGYQLITVPPPSSGGVTLCEMLNVLAGYPIKRLGFRSPMATAYTIEAMYFAYMDRNQYLGDPNFVDMPLKYLLSKEKAQKIRKKIAARLSGSAKAVKQRINKDTESMQTIHYSVLDKDGNAVAVTYTLNSLFGAKVMPAGLGFFLNNEMDDFTLQPGLPNLYGLVQGEANSIEPEKRPLSSMTPTIVLKNGKVFMVLGAAGGSTIISQVLLVIQNVIDFDMDIISAVNLPRFHMQGVPNKVSMEPGVFSYPLMRQLKKMNYKLKIGSFFHSLHWGVTNAILVKDHKRPKASPDSRAALKF